MDDANWLDGTDLEDYAPGQLFNKIPLLPGLTNSAERLKEVEATKQDLSKNALSWGIPFLDAAYRGILPVDLILCGAYTGKGKTELMTHIASHSAKQGKKVFMFALEAFKGEIELRIKYKYLVGLFLQKNPKTACNFNFRDYMFGDYDHDLAPFEDECVVYIKQFLENMYVFYKDPKKTFRPNDFKSMCESVSGDIDLFVSDHIHYFDYTSNNENKELTDTVKMMRILTEKMGKPIINAGHLKKRDHRNKVIMPTEDDFHGSSNLVKMATGAFIIGPGPMLDKRSSVTYFRPVKSRLLGSITQFCGKVLFDTELNMYADEYKIGRLIKNDTEFEIMPEIDWPPFFKS